MPYLKIPDEILALDLPLAQRLVLALVVQLAKEGGACTASNIYIEQRLGLGKKTASRHLQALVDVQKVSFYYGEGGRRSIVPTPVFFGSTPPQIADPPQNVEGLQNVDPPQIADPPLRKLQTPPPQIADPILDNSREYSNRGINTVPQKEQHTAMPPDAGASGDAQKKREDEAGQEKESKKAEPKKTKKVPSDFDRKAAAQFRQLFKKWGATQTGNQDPTHMRKLREALGQSGSDPENQVRALYTYLAKRGPAGPYQTVILSCAALYKKITTLQAEIQRNTHAQHQPTRNAAHGKGPDYHARLEALLGQRQQP